MQSRSASATVDESETFKKDGVVLVRGLFQPNFVDQLRQEISSEVVAWSEGLRQNDVRYVHAGRTNVLEISDLFRIIPMLSDLQLHQVLAAFAGPLLGVSGLRLYQDALLEKDPHGGEVPWHQDSYYAAVAVPVVTAWMPLVSVGPSAGPVEYAAGSAADGLVNFERDGIELSEHVAAKGYPILSYDTKPGDVLFHTGQTLHRSPANAADAPRPVFTAFFFEDGARVCKPPYQRASRSQLIYFPGRRPGDSADTELNPIVWREGPAPLGRLS
jgi:ectoine hydroxylase-related dioxygenase (phytanoyl-CoA dioxygenase family)